MFFLMTTPQLTPNSPPIQYYNPAELQYKTLPTEYSSLREHLFLPPT